MATCPECDAELNIDDDDLEDMEVGDPWDCDACGSRLRVSSLNPLEFETDEEEEEEEEEEESDDASNDEDGDLEDFDDDDDDDDSDDGDWDE